MKSITLVLFILISNITFSQQTIRIKNGSFEKVETHNVMVVAVDHWDSFGFEKFPDESPPDVIDNADPVWDIPNKTIFGSKYISLVCRDNDSYESIGQKLVKPLNAGSKYRFSVYLCLSNIFLSKSRLTSKEVNFNKPVVLRIKGGGKFRQELLIESPPIVDHRWTKYTFEIEVKAPTKFLVFEVGFSSNEKEPYNGHILIDNISDLVEVVK